MLKTEAHAQENSKSPTEPKKPPMLPQIFISHNPIYSRLSRDIDQPFPFAANLWPENLCSVFHLFFFLFFFLSRTSKIPNCHRQHKSSIKCAVFPPEGKNPVCLPRPIYRPPDVPMSGPAKVPRPIDRPAHSPCPDRPRFRSPSTDQHMRRVWTGQGSRAP
ncbi:hypothetical protein VTJ04DRAFT_3499 [Mycothermus thermophilus]|uniref:uncharacterized protein n=1 Tax=Humicola insolens TaxID=85995 RepID=UPI0037422B34